MNNIEKIKAEIERLYDGEAPKHDQQCDFDDGYFTGIDVISNFIDSLPEEDTTEDLNELIQKWDRIDINTVLKVKVKATGKVIDGFYDGKGHFDHFIDHDVFDRYSIDEVELIPHEESNNELEKEVERYFYYECTDNTPHEVIARHFAEWGAKHLKM